jgi:hypothetical protein
VSIFSSGLGRKILDILTIIMALLQASSAAFAPQVSDLRGVGTAIDYATSRDERSASLVDPNLP